MIRRTASVLLAGFVAGVTLFALAGPAHAGCNEIPPLPDGRIRRVGGVYTGAGVIDCSKVADNTVSLNRQIGESGRFEFKFRNEEATTADILIRYFPNVDSRFKVTFLKGTKDITDKIDYGGGGKTFRDVAPGASTPIITVRIKVRATGQPGDEKVVAIGGNYGSEESNYDAVFAAVAVPE